MFKLVVFIFLLLVAVGFLVQFADWNRHKATMEKSFYESTGYLLDIKGNLHGKILPSFSLSMEDVALKIENVEPNIILDIQHISFKVKMLDLLLGDLVFEKVKLKDFIIRRVDSQKNIFEAVEMSAQLTPKKDGLFLENILLIVDSGEYRGHLNCIFFSNEISGNFKAASSTLNYVEAASLPISSFNYFNGKIGINIDKLVIGDVILKDTDIVLKLNQTQRDILFNGNLSQGKLTGQYRMKNIGTKNEIHRLLLELSEAKADTLLKQFAPHLNISEGAINFIVDAEDRKPWLLSENVVGNGAIFVTGLMLNDFSEKLDALLVKFEIKDGQLQATEDIVLQTSRWKGIGTGKMDMKKQRLDFRMTLQEKSHSTVSDSVLKNTMIIEGTILEPEVKLYGQKEI